ncbi:MAG TPA: YibE/F family protein [Nitrolancea sp.]|jgi:uncharacterized membrane protein|nr:YibE/F family protein [Nitrolancea sp.]
MVRWNRVLLLLVFFAALTPAVAFAAVASAPPVVRGKVVAVQDKISSNGGSAVLSQGTEVLTVRLSNGAHAGQEVQAQATILDFSQAAQRFKPGDQVYLSSAPSPTAGQPDEYYVIDRVRTTPLLILAGGFALLILLMSRWKGLRSLIGMAFTFFVLVEFLMPRILDGDNPVVVSLIAAFLIFGVTLFLVHGIGRMTVAAVSGTTMSLVLTAILAVLFVTLTQLTGLGSEEAGYLQAPIGGGTIDPRGLLLGGIIIGALGVLDDVTVSQSSTVFELRKANPAYTMQRLFTSGINVGRDHIATTVNTLVLAYVGAALPLLLLFTRTDQPFMLILNREEVTEEIVRTLVGTIGLVTAVPFTTFVASWLAVRTNPGEIEESGHGHHHH